MKTLDKSTIEAMITQLNIVLERYKGFGSDRDAPFIKGRRLGFFDGMDRAIKTLKLELEMADFLKRKTAPQSA